MTDMPPTPPPPAWPPAIRPDRGSRAGLVTAALSLAIVLALLAGTGIALVTVAAADGRIGHGSAAAADPLPVLSPRSAGRDLRELALPAPADSRPWRNQPAERELTVDGLAELSQNPTGRAAFLREHNFVRGFARFWITADNRPVNLRLYLFGSAPDAERFYTADIASNSRGRWGTGSAIAGVPGGRSFLGTTASTGTVTALSMARSADVVALVFVTEPAPGTRELANQVLDAQYQRL